MKLKLSLHLPKIVSNPHFWIVLAMFAIGLVLHYAEQLGLVAPGSHLGITRHAMDRVLFLLPITYTGFIFGMKGGLVSIAVSLGIMLPRALFISSSPSDALLETGVVVLVAALVNLLFVGQLQEKERRREAFLKLQASQKELQAQIEAVKKNERRLAALNAVCDIICQSLELPEILEGAVERVKEVMEVDAALVFLIEESSGELALKYYQGVSDKFVAGLKGMKVGEGFNGRVAQTGKPLLVKDASRDPRLTRAVVKEEGIKAQLIVPLKSKGKIMGTLCVARHEPRQFFPDEVEILAAIGKQIGTAIENSYLCQEVRLTAERLHASERNYRELFENAYDAIWIHDLEGNILTANKACEELTGYSLEELKQMNAIELLSEGSQEVAKEIRHKLAQGEVLNRPWEVELVRKNGSKVTVELATTLVTGNALPLSFQHIARDITEEKQMRENLRFYAQQVTKAQEEERKRIARELHDDTAQALIDLARRLDDLSSLSENLSGRDIAALLGNARERTNAILEGVRRFSQDLRPSILDDLGLLPALEWLISDLEKRSGIRSDLKVIGNMRRFPSEAELLFFRIVQEALRNTERHAQASQVEVTVEFGADKTIVTVRDNGKGFELSGNVGDLSRTGKLGLVGMQERARLLGGSLKIESRLGKGTTVIIEAPI